MKLTTQAHRLDHQPAHGGIAGQARNDALGFTNEFTNKFTSQRESVLFTRLGFTNEFTNKFTGNPGFGEA